MHKFVSLVLAAMMILSPVSSLADSDAMEKSATDEITEPVKNNPGTSVGIATCVLAALAGPVALLCVVAIPGGVAFDKGREKEGRQNKP